jgi:hypothetical protein
MQQAEHGRPRGKVVQAGPASWRPLLKFEGLVPLGLHSSRAAAEAAYDLAKIKVGGLGTSRSRACFETQATAFLVEGCNLPCDHARPVGCRS